MFMGCRRGVVARRRGPAYALSHDDALERAALWRKWSTLCRVEWSPVVTFVGTLRFGFAKGGSG